MCQISNIAGNGVVIANPLETNIVNAVDRAASTGEFLSGKEIYKMLQSGLHVLTNGKINMPIHTDDTGLTRLDRSNIESMLKMNMHFAINYGATEPVFDIKAYKKKGPTENFPHKRQNLILPSHNYYVSINEKQLNSMQKLSTPIKLDDYATRQMYQLVSNHVRGSVESKNFQLVKNPYVPVAAAEAAIVESTVIQDTVGKQLSLFDFDADSREFASGTAVQYQDVADQIESIRKTFQREGIEVGIEVDPSLDVKGRIEIKDGKTTIKFNPSKMTEDTHIHEFSHLLIELLGDDNPSVKAAIEEVRKTKLYQEVKAKYPELDQATLDKEVVVTAIGLAGAQINRKNPNKFQTIINRIFRAIAKALNISKESSVEELAKTLMEGRFDSAMFKAPLKNMMADSRSDERLKNDFENTLADVKIAVLESIQRLERAGAEANEKAIERLKLMSEDLKTVTKIEQLLDFVTYATRTADRSEDILNEIDEKYSPDMTVEERLQMINQLHKVADTLSDFYGGTEKSQSLMHKIRLLVNEKAKKLGSKLTTEQKATDAGYKKLTELEQKLKDAIDRMEIVSNEYNEIGIPMMADLLMEYKNDDLNDQIYSVIKNITDNKRLIAPDKNADWRALEQQFKDGVIKTKEELFKAQLELNIKQMESKLIGRDTIIAELREAQKDKSSFSYLLDPLIYSSQASLQMFAMTLKNKMYEANDDTQDVAYAIADAYRKYSESKGSGANPVSFNEDILETHEYSVFNYQTNKMEKKNLLTFVQPLDVTRYRIEERKMFDGLRDKYKIPAEDQARIDWFEDKKNKVNVAKYYEEISMWYAANSEPSPDAIAQLQRLTNEFVAVSDKMQKALASQDGDRAAYYSEQLKEIQSLRSKIYDSRRKQFRGNAVQPLASKYTNAKYTALKANKPAFEFHTALLEQYKKSQALVGKNGPVRNSWEKFSYVCPAILADGLEKIQKDGAIDYLKLQKREAFNFLSTDTHYGEAINANKESRKKSVPIFYVNPTDEKLVTRDMASAIVQFAGMANMYQRKAEIHGAVMLMREIIEKRETITTTAGNNPIINKYSKIVGRTRYKTTDQASNNFKHLDEWIDTIFFGEEELKASLDRFGKDFSLNKAAGKLASLTALNNLAFNALQAGNQFLIDNVRLVEEGVSGQFFGKGDLAWAKMVYHGQLQSMSQLKDFEKFVPSTKIGQAIQYFDALSDVLSSNGESRTGPVALKAAKHIPMVLQGIMENETAVTRMLAMMKSYEGKLKDAQGNVIMNAEGKPANLWDVFIKDEKTGRFSIDPKVANAQALRVRFRDKIAGLTKKTNQVKNKFDDAVLQRRWYGKLIMLFRRYFVPSLRRYYGQGSGALGAGLHRDLELGTVSEGIYHTAFRFFKEAIQKKGSFGGVYSTMEDFEKQNMKRFATQGMFMLACILILACLSDDDDDDQSYAEQYLIYQALRMQSELSQFYNPKEFVKLAESPTATTRTVGRIANLIDQAGIQLSSFVTGNMEGVNYENKSGIHQKGDNKFLAQLEALAPLVGGLEKSGNPKEAAKWFNLGAGSGK